MTLPAEAAGALPRRTLWVLAVGCGAAVANLYYAQPLLAEMAADLGVSEGLMGLAPALSAVGYALGLLFFVPLGDVLERRGLIVAMLAAVTLALLAAALAPGFPWLAAASLAVGLTTVAPQLLVPLAATLAGPSERGRVVGTVMSGLLIGILASRTFSGLLGGWLGWRAVYLIAAGISAVLLVSLRLLLPCSRSEGPPLPYLRLLRSLGGLLRDEPVLRQSCLFGAAAFGAFSAFWNTLAYFLAGPPYHYGSATVGLFGLVGVAGAVAASAAGRLADRYNPRLTVAAGMVLMALAYVLFWAVGQELAWLLAGVILLDVGAQASHISNQARIYAVRPEARNRMNTAYMVASFLGGSVGSGLGALGWEQGGWGGVCSAGVVLLALGLAAFVASAGGSAGRGQLTPPGP